LIGNNGKVNIDSEYSVHKVGIDVGSFVKGLRRTSESALKEFAKNATSHAACAEFQRTLRDEKSATAEHPTEQYRVRPQVTASIERCAIAVIGDDNRAFIEADYRAPTADLELEPMLCRDDALAMALAGCLAQPDDPEAKRKFDQCVARAITPDILTSLLSTADFGPSKTKIRRFGSSAAFEGGVTTLGEGNTTRSHISVKAHKVGPIDTRPLGGLVPKSGPTPVTPPPRSGPTHSVTGSVSSTRPSHHVPQSVSPSWPVAPVVSSTSPPTHPVRPPVVSSTTQPSHRPVVSTQTAAAVTRAAEAAFRRARRNEREDRERRKRAEGREDEI